MFLGLNEIKPKTTIHIKGTDNAKINVNALRCALKRKLGLLITTVLTVSAGSKN